MHRAPLCIHWLRAGIRTARAPKYSIFILERTDTTGRSDFSAAHHEFRFDYPPRSLLLLQCRRILGGVRVCSCHYGVARYAGSRQLCCHFQRRGLLLGGRRPLPMARRTVCILGRGGRRKEARGSPQVPHRRLPSILWRVLQGNGRSAPEARRGTSIQLISGEGLLADRELVK